METRPLGRTGADVSVIGLGTWQLGGDWGDVDDDAAEEVLVAALDAGVTLLDTADAYCLGPDELGHGELLIARALREYGTGARDVLVATKGGHTRPSASAWELDGRPAYLKAAAQASLRRLGGDAIGLFQLHRPDPRTPWAESMGALRELVDAGTIRMAGVSNADPEQIRQAAAIVGDGLAAVQNELSPAFRTSEPEIAVCDELGLAFLPWSPLGGMGSAADLGSTFAAFGEVAREHGVSPQQVCLAWLLAKSPGVVPIPGSSRPRTIRESAAAADLELGADELDRLDAVSGSG
jgi:aryl-alcohol dehydrogenase-like predicted oxidoreductase